MIYIFGFLKRNPWCFSNCSVFWIILGSPFSFVLPGEPKLGHSTEWLFSCTEKWKEKDQDISGKDSIVFIKGFRLHPRWQLQFRAGKRNNSIPEIPTLATASRRLLSPKGTGDWPVSFCAEVTLFGQGTQVLRDAAGSFVLGGILCKWCHISMIIDVYFVVFFCLTVGHLAAAEVVGSCDLPAEAGYLVCNCVQLWLWTSQGMAPFGETVRAAEASFCWSLFLGQSWKPQHAKCLGKEPVGLCRIGVLHVKNIADRRVVPPADLNNSDESRPIKLAIIKGLYYTSLNLHSFHNRTIHRVKHGEISCMEGSPSCITVSRPKIFCFTVCCLAALHAQGIYRCGGPEWASASFAGKIVMKFSELGN